MVKMEPVHCMVITPLGSSPVVRTTRFACHPAEERIAAIQCAKLIIPELPAPFFIQAGIIHCVLFDPPGTVKQPMVFPIAIIRTEFDFPIGFLLFQRGLDAHK